MKLSICTVQVNAYFAYQMRMFSLQTIKGYLLNPTRFACRCLFSLRMWQIAPKPGRHNQDSRRNYGCTTFENLVGLLTILVGLWTLNYINVHTWKLTRRAPMAHYNRHLNHLEPLSHQGAQDQALIVRHDDRHGVIQWEGLWVPV